MKHMKIFSRKALSAVLALAVILCSITATLSVFAGNEGAAEEPYNVYWRAPAIPMYESTMIDLSNVNVQLTEDAALTDGTAVTWTLDPEATGAWLVGTKLYVAGKGNYKLTAASGENTLNVWVVANKDGEKDFYLENVDGSKLTAFSDSEWAHSKVGNQNYAPTTSTFSAATASTFTVVSNTALTTEAMDYDTGVAVYRSEILKDFADYTIDMKFKPQSVKNGWAKTESGTKAAIGIIARATVGTGEGDKVAPFAAGSTALLARMHTTGGIALAGIGDSSVDFGNDGSANRALLNSVADSSVLKYGTADSSMVLFRSNKDYSAIRTATLKLDKNRIVYSLDSNVIFDSSAQTLNQMGIRTPYDEYTEAGITQTLTETQLAELDDTQKERINVPAKSVYYGAGEVILSDGTKVNQYLSLSADDLYTNEKAYESFAEDLAAANLSKGTFGVYVSRSAVGVYSLSAKLNDPQVPACAKKIYTVSNAAPAFPVFVNTKADFSGMPVQLTENGAYYPAKDLTWEVDSSYANPGAFAIDNNGNFFIPEATGIFALTATNESTGESARIYAVVNEEGNYEFNLVDLNLRNASSNYIADDWYYQTGGRVETFKNSTFASRTTLAQSGTDGIGFTNIWHKSGVWMYNSEILKDFSDYTVKTVAKDNGSEKTTWAEFDIIARATLDDTTDGTNVFKAGTNSLVMGVRNLGGLRVYDLADTSKNFVSGATLHNIDSSLLKHTTSDGSYVWRNDLKDTAGVANSAKERSIELYLSGNRIVYSLDNNVIFDSAEEIKTLGFASGDSKTPSYTESTATNDSFNSFMESSSFGKGTVGFGFTRIGVKIYSLKVSLNNTSAETMLPYTSFEYFKVDDSQPFLPMTAGTQVATANFKFVKSDASTVTASSLNWTVADGETGIAYEGGIIKAYKKGTYKLTAGDETLYVVVKAPGETDYTVFENDYRNLYNADGTPRTDYDKWSSYIVKNGTTILEFTDHVNSNTNYATEDIGGFQPYLASDLATAVSSMPQGDYFSVATVLEDELVKKLKNYTVDATLYTKNSGRNKVGLGGRIDMNGSSFTSLCGVTIGSGGTWDGDKVPVFKGTYSPVGRASSVNPAWYQMNSQNLYTLHKYSLTLSGDTLTYSTPGIKDEVITETGISVNAGGAGIIQYERMYTSSINGIVSIYDFKVTAAVDEAKIAYLAAQDISGYNAADYEEEPEIKELENPVYVVDTEWTHPAKGTITGGKLSGITGTTNVKVNVTLPSIANGINIDYAGAIFKNGYNDVYVNTSNQTSYNLLGDSLRKKVYTIDLSQIDNPLTLYGGAFYGSFAEKVVLPKQDTKFDFGRVFEQNTRLMEVENTEYIKEIGQENFVNCNSLISFKFPSDPSVTATGARILASAISLTSVIIPENITIISNSAFDGCLSLYDIQLPSRVTSIGTRAFYGCKSLKTINIPETVESIGANAFNTCSVLTGEITLGEACATLGESAFAGTKISKITIYNAACEIGDGAIPTTAEVWGLTGSTAQAYAEANSLTFHAIDTTEKVITISKNAKDYLPTTCYGAAVAWDEQTNSNIEITNVEQPVKGSTETAVYSVIAGLSEGTTTITGTLEGITGKITVTVNVTAYDEAAYSHFLKGADATVAAKGDGNYTITFPDSLNVKFDTFKINGVYGTLTPVVTDGVAGGNVYEFNPANYGSTTKLVDIQIVYEAETDTANVTNKLYHMGESIKEDAETGLHSIGFTTRATSIIYDAENSGAVISGKFRSDFAVNGEAVTPVLIGALVAPEALTTDASGIVDTSKLVLTSEQVNALAAGETVDVVLKTIGESKYSAQNVVITKINDVTGKYADFKVVLNGMPSNMTKYNMVYRSYIIYQSSGGNYGILYEDVTTRSYDDVKERSGSVAAGKVYDAKSPSAFANTSNAVICWGDSITQSTVGKSYPSQLEANLSGQYKVYNAGVAGETGIAIMSRNNLVDLGNGDKGAGLLMNDVTFSAGQATSGDIAQGDITQDMPRGRAVFKSASDELIRYVGFGNQLPTVNLIINGESGYKLSYSVPSGAVWGKYSYFITREDSTEALTLPAGSTVKFDYSGIDSDAYATVVLFGANDGESANGTAIIEKYQAFKAKTPNTIFIVPYFFQTDKTDEYVAALGENALCINEYFSQKAFDDYGVFPDYIDLARIKAHKMPYEFMAGDDSSYGVEDCHLNALGYKILADLVYEKGIQLGYWN